MGAAGPTLEDLRAPPNVVTLIRVALIPVVLWLIAVDRRGWAVAVLAFMVVTDGLDGYLARRTGRITELGKILDPVADKLAIDAVLIHLTARGEFPLWALAVFLVRDAAILAGAAMIARRVARVPAANAIGKIALVVLAAMTIAYVANVAPLEGPLIAAGVVFAIWSVVAYGGVARRALIVGPR